MMLTAWTPSLQSLPAIRARIFYWSDDVLIVNIIVAQSIRSGADRLRPAQLLWGVSLSTGYELVTALDIDVSFFGCSYFAALDVEDACIIRSLCNHGIHSRRIFLQFDFRFAVVCLQIHHPRLSTP